MTEILSSDWDWEWGIRMGPGPGDGSIISWATHHQTPHNFGTVQVLHDQGWGRGG